MRYKGNYSAVVTIDFDLARIANGMMCFGNGLVVIY